MSYHVPVKKFDGWEGLDAFIHHAGMYSSIHLALT
jgi:hypothetical protein